MTLEVKLNERNSQRADELARQTGKSAEKLVNAAFERFADVAAQDATDGHQKFLAWREALLRIEGMWKDREDLPNFGQLRKTWDRSDRWSR